MGSEVSPCQISSLLLAARADEINEIFEEINKTSRAQLKDCARWIGIVARACQQRVQKKTVQGGLVLLNLIHGCKIPSNPCRWHYEAPKIKLHLPFASTPKKFKFYILALTSN